MSSKHSVITIGINQSSVKPSPVNREEGYFGQLVCTAAGTITVKGTNVMTYIAQNGDWTGHIDPATGVAGVGATSCAADGYYEALPATAVPFVLTAGDELNGTFTEFATDGNFKGFGYAHSIDASGPEYNFA